MSLKYYIIYCRVSPKGSSHEGETTVKLQEQICRDFINRAGGKVFAVFTDDLQTGTNTDRSGLQMILSQLNSSEWDNLCVYRMDRLTRSLVDQLTICKKFARVSKGIVSATEPTFDYSTSLGKLQMAQLAAINEYYRDVLADNTRNKMISIAAAGEWAPGLVPIGYKREGRKKNTLVVDPRGAAKVRDIFEMYSNKKYATKDICIKYSMTRSQVLWILRNRLYIGKIVYAGKEYQGKHPPIISEELFKRVQMELPDAQTRRRPKSEKRNYLLTGLLRCHCGKFICPASAKSGQYFYYICTDNINCKNRVSGTALEKAVLDALQKNTYPPDIRSKILKEIERRRLAYLETCTPEMNALIKAKKQATEEREKLFSLILNLHGDKARFINMKLEKLTTEIETIDKQLDSYSKLKDAKTILYDEMNQRIDSIADLAKRLKENPTDFNIQRQLFVANIDKIQNVEKGMFKIYFAESSGHRHVWLPRQDSNLN